MDVPPSVVAEVEAGLSNGSLPVLGKIASIFTCLKANALAYPQVLLPSQTLIHPQNRSGSMVNSVDVWQKGLKMLKIGIQPGLLNESNAVAFELSVNSSKRQEQVAANQKLVQASNGSLARVTGQERFLTVASSHTAAFCKAVEQGIQPMDQSQTVTENSDPGLQQLISNGWPFLVISNVVEAKWPDLPNFLQAGLNATNSSYQQITEIEAACQMCEYMRHGDTLEQALSKVQAVDPVCKRSLEAIAFYVARFAGPDYTLVKFLSQFSNLTCTLVTASKPSWL